MTSRREHAYRTMREAVITGAWPPGHRLIERDLAAELDVSRIPLREAMRQLAGEGLVTAVAGQGTIVSALTETDVADLFDLRESLEPLAARLAAERRDPAGLARLRSTLEQAAALSEEERADLLDANAAFHTELVAASGNALLAQVMDPLEARVRRLFHYTERNPARQCHEHTTQYEAIASGDGDLAASLALEHAREGREPALETVRQRRTEAVDPLEATRTRRRKKVAE
ncbi:GntR family transcriptional regulator [Glycomyces buryatensis]|uniref:GntR family transcriptional regulator n=1 Tax=Glycomyces buryatensis TaxID=2570927 RepID=A0A4S8QEV8_9ACTN|nr:GntR family transcriptional regulator [Glycomyces buryatensis]THV41642.1 GntR family transcriptional regulator [Glycomyces buryatensis]